MPRYRLLYATCFLFILTMTGCKKYSQSENTFTAGMNIYMAGELDGKAVYWKNGKPFALGYGCQVSSIAVSGEDVYVCGDSVGDHLQAVYWKNGIRHTLPGSLSSAANGVAISGGDVYFAGLTGNFNMAVYWKNGVVYNLKQGAIANAIAFSGSDMIVAGHFFTDFDTAIVWKNSSMSWHTNGGGNFNAIAVQGTDTYIAGGYHNDGVYWKNDSMVLLLANTLVSSVAVSGSDIYFAGGTEGTNASAVYWKNGELVNLPGPYPSYATGIAIAGTDIYITGLVTINSRTVPVYWKNGTLVKLGDTGEASAICIGQ